MEHDEVAIAFVNGRFIDKKTREIIRENPSEEVLFSHKWDGPVARVRRAYGLTLNLTNYESARIDVSLEVPCLVEDIDNADIFAQSWVEKRVAEEANAIRQGVHENKPKRSNY